MNPQAALCPATEQGTHALLIHSLRQQILKIKYYEQEQIS